MVYDFINSKDVRFITKLLKQLNSTRNVSKVSHTLDNAGVLFRVDLIYSCFQEANFVTDHWLINVIIKKPAQCGSKGRLDLYTTIDLFESFSHNHFYLSTPNILMKFKINIWFRSTKYKKSPSTRRILCGRRGRIESSLWFSCSGYCVRPCQPLVLLPVSDPDKKLYEQRTDTWPDEEGKMLFQVHKPQNT